MRGRTLARLDAALLVVRGKLLPDAYKNDEAAELFAEEVRQEQDGWRKACADALGFMRNMPDGSKEFPAFAGYPANRI